MSRDVHRPAAPLQPRRRGRTCLRMTEVEDRGNHLVIRSQAGEIRPGGEMIGKVLVDNSRMFILHHGVR